MTKELYEIGIFKSIGLTFDVTDPWLKSMGIKLPQDSKSGLSYEYTHILEQMLKRIALAKSYTPESRRLYYQGIKDLTQEEKLDRSEEIYKNAA